MGLAVTGITDSQQEFPQTKSKKDIGGEALVVWLTAGALRKMIAHIVGAVLIVIAVGGALVGSRRAKKSD